MLEGSRLCGKETSSPKPKSGEQWMPFGKVTLVPEDRRPRGSRPPVVLSTDVCCLCVFLRTFASI